MSKNAFQGALRDSKQAGDGPSLTKKQSHRVKSAYVIVGDHWRNRFGYEAEVVGVDCTGPRAIVSLRYVDSECKNEMATCELSKMTKEYGVSLVRRGGMLLQ
jgi:hypothetical protein